MKLTKDSIEAEAISIVQNEKKQWEDAYVFVTEKVAFKIKDLIRTCRKNYWGVFDEPSDPTTGRKKIWYPLTEEFCDAVAPRIKIRTRDITFRASNHNGYYTADFARAWLHDYLVTTYFGETLDNSSLIKSIDGTSVLKTWLDGKEIRRRNVDLLNIFIDPQAESIQSAYRFTERALMYESDIKNTDWMNKDVLTTEGLDPNDTRNSNNNSNVKTRDVWEMWGKIPKYLITGESDDKEEIDGRIVVSGLEAGTPVVHALRVNTRTDKHGITIKPYEEDWYIKVPGRWYGKGVAEKLLTLQLWINTIINIRVNRALVAQLGLFKIRKGSNITPSQLSRLGSNGAVVVNNMDDIEQLIMQEASTASYQDESNIRSIAQRITSAFDIVTGESLPASTPATNAVLQSKSAGSIFGKIQERSGMFVQRWIDRHVLPLEAKIVQVKDIVRYMGYDDKFDKMVERAAIFIVNNEYEAQKANGKFPTKEQVDAEVARVKAELREKKSLFLEVQKEILADSLDTHVQVTNEDLDVSVRIDKLTTALQMAPEFKADILKNIYDLLNIPIPEGMNDAPITIPGSSQMIPGGQGGTGPSTINALSTAMGK